MKTIPRMIAAGVLIGLLAQGFQPAAIPAVHPSPTPAVADPSVAEVLQRSCGNCHSHRTELPWYAHVSPVSWLIARDVQKGRAKMSLSQGPLTPSEAQEIADAVSSGNMPPWQYRLMHREARLTKADVNAILMWADDLQAEHARKTAKVEPSN